MTAKEMFEELGYKYFYEAKDNHYDSILYFEYSNDSGDSIKFWLNDKTIDYPYVLDIKLLKAINQQCKELGWIND